jgi:hypothetical protein
MSAESESESVPDDGIDPAPVHEGLTDDARASLSAAMASTPENHPDAVKVHAAARKMGNRRDYTPGPWMVAGETIYAERNGLYELLLTARRCSLPDPGEVDANLRLAAAAPELFEVLAPLMDRDWFKDGERGIVVISLDADKVRAALLKATGKAPTGEPHSESADHNEGGAS